MAYLYTFINSQQKKAASYTSILYAKNPDAHICKHTCLVDAYTYSHITRVDDLKELRWGAGEGVTYCKTLSHSRCAQRGHSGQCCFKAVSKAESFLLQPLNLKFC